MALDLLNDEGELDRGKVAAELDRLLNLLPIPGTKICKVATASVREGFVTLLDEVQHEAYMNGYDDCQEVA